MHGGETGYSIDNADVVLISNESREGDWVNVLDWLPKKEPSRSIFTVGIDHGKNVKGASYAYTVYTSITEKTLLKKEKKKAYAILENTENIQAVQFKELKETAIVFHKAGTLVLDKNLQITSTFPGIVIVSKKRGCFSIAILEPTSKIEKGEIMLTGNVKIGTYSKTDNTSTLPIDFSENKGMPIYLSSK
ncbi:polysaccharide lyase beta-sandwich domain-containing protein [Algibacter lectus]|uniref:polysaccharide lyase beta-sandwich domain-containing protein n=1 Tax=Algibacter lectus TaxID=221126 RepID=UPI0005A9C615|nr:polysaccharide lyase beta-sandwich domain-containing protein [Algibacter lectus]